MKLSKTVKKVLPFLGVGIGAVAAIGATTSIALKNQNNTLSTNTNLVNYSNNIVLDEANQNQTNRFTLNKKEASIEENEIVEAIDSFEGNKSFDNLNQAYKFIDQGLSSEDSLISLVQENVKYYSFDVNDTNLYTLPESCIYINNNIDGNSFNVYIDLSQIDGYVLYYTGNICINNHHTINGANYQWNGYHQEMITKTDAISFNAVKTETEAVQYDDNSNRVLNILFLVSLIFGGVAILLIIILIYRKLVANKKYVKSEI